MALSTQLDVRLAATLTGTADLSTPTDSLVEVFKMVLTSGTGANQADMSWHDQRTINTSTTDSLDLAGSLSNVFGTTQTFARIKGLMVVASSSNTDNIQVARPAANGVPLFLAASDGLVVRPGGLLLWAASDSTGVAVTAGTGDGLSIINPSGSVTATYQIVIIGASA